jgi:hypothetical protein
LPSAGLHSGIVKIWKKCNAARHFFYGAAAISPFPFFFHLRQKLPGLALGA